MSTTSFRTDAPKPPPLPPPPAPPLPPQRYGARAATAIARLAQPFFYGSRPPSAQGHREGESRPSGLKSTIPRITGATSSHSLIHKTGLPIAALDISPGRTHAILAGRDILKTIQIQGATCSEDFNLRSTIIAYASTHNSSRGLVSAQHKDQLAANDVKWSHGKFDTTIATAAANGRIVLYDINRAGVELARLHEHTRQVHRVAFNPYQGALLLSGSQDATIRMWDIRDLAGERSVMTCRSINKFSGNNEGIRDLRWSPTDGVEFAAGTDNGVIQRWDFRKENAPLLKINAHDKTCHSVDWHPSGKFLASAGADRNVKVWDFKSADRRMKPSWQLRAPQAVQNVRWRPVGGSSETTDMSGQQCTYLATTYDQHDPRIHIWDFRRPHTPNLEIDRYDTPATGLLWCTEDLLWSVGLAGMFMQTNLKYATKPIERRNINVVATAPSGEICYFSKARARKPMALVDPRNGFLQRSNTGGSSGEKFGSSHSVTECSLEDTGILNSSLKKRRQKTLSTRTTSAPMGNTPPSVGKNMAAARLEDAMKLEERHYHDQVSAYGHVLGTFDAEAFKYLARHYRPPLAISRLTKNLDMQKAILSVFEENARLAAYTGQYRLAQSWRILGAAVSNDMEKKLPNNTIFPEFQSPTAQVIDVPVKGTGYSRTPDVSQVQQTRSRSPAASNFESTSNMPTPLAMPVQESSNLFLTVEGEMRLNDLPSTQLLGPGWKMHHTVGSNEDSVPVIRAHADEVPSTGSVIALADGGYHDNVSECPDAPVIFGSFTDIDQQMSERRAALNNYRAKPRYPLRLDDSLAVSRSSSVAACLERHDSNESFQMFSASTDSNPHSLTLKESFGESQLSGPSGPLLESWDSSHDKNISGQDIGSVPKGDPVENGDILRASFMASAEQKLHPPTYIGNFGSGDSSTRRPSKPIPPIIHISGPHARRQKSLAATNRKDAKSASPFLPTPSPSEPVPWSATALLPPVVDFHLYTLSDTQFPTYLFLYLCDIYPHLLDISIVTTTLASYHQRLISLSLFIEAAKLRLPKDEALGVVPGLRSRWAFILPSALVGRCRIRRDERIKLRESEGRREKMRAGSIIKDGWTVGESHAPPPLSIGVVLYPHFQALDVFGPIDAFNVLSEDQPLTLSVIARTLDPMRTSSGAFTQLILPTHTFATAPPLDVLLVPGGPGARSPDMQPVVDFIASVYPSLKYLISVCTGAPLVARTGLVDGMRATTNKRAWEWVIGQRAQVKWVPRARWVVDGKWWSSSGVSAGIDVAFAWMAHVWGEEVAKDASLKMEYTRWVDSTRDPFADVYGLGEGCGVDGTTAGLHGNREMKQG
ncbi:SEA (Seh1-associated) complex subunit [Xylographa bjoerkii]|nr:SEA (Seh1-associated) complex subunit [Xylographa bjoerkii]